jgi:hypothetical protein
MRPTRIRHHSEETVSQAILRLLSDCSTRRVAVAYCGEAAHQFFPERPEQRPHDLRIIIDACDTAVKWGLTNPKGIERLLGLTHQVRSLAGLHAKVWVFDDKAALVGSVNLSESSIEQQFQLALEISDRPAVRRIAVWFGRLWERSTPLDSVIVQRLAGLRPIRQRIRFRSRTKAKLTKWRAKAPEPPLAPSDIDIGVTAAEIKRLLRQFRNNECPYPDSGGASCFQMAKWAEHNYAQLGHELRSLMRRRSSWGKDQLVQIFDIAYTNGRAAKLRKPAFVRQRPVKVARSLKFLLRGTGDPYIRFEKVLAPRSGYKLAGMAAPGLSFLMHLWEPDAFAVINAPIDKALKRLNVRFRLAAQREGQAFKDHTAAVKTIARLTRLRSFARVDHFLDALGKGHIA